MSVPTRNDGLTRKEEMNVSAAAMSEVPWVPAATVGVIVAGADLVLHVVTGHISLGVVGTAASAGTVALFAVAGGGAMLRNRSSRALRWARRNPWRFAMFPGVATAVVVFVLSIVLGSAACSATSLPRCGTARSPTESPAGSGRSSVSGTSHADLGSPGETNPRNALNLDVIHTLRPDEDHVATPVRSCLEPVGGAEP